MVEPTTFSGESTQGTPIVSGPRRLPGDLVQRGQIVRATAGEDVVPREREVARHGPPHVPFPDDAPVVALGRVHELVEAREINSVAVDHGRRGDEVRRAIAAEGFAGPALKR